MKSALFRGFMVMVVILCFAAIANSEEVSYELTVTVVGDGGTVDPNSGFYPEGTEVTLTATPNEGQCYAQWTGTDNDTSTEFINTITMTGDKVVTVEFGLPRAIFVPGGYSTIQDAIDAAHNCDIIILGVALYNENFSFNGKNIMVTSTNPDNPGVVAVTVIQGTGTGSVVTFSGSEDSNCVLLGVTITGGNTVGDGGGICGNGTGAIIGNCIIRNNHADNSGGGVSDCNGSMLLCEISDNTAEYGGGISCLYESPTIENCTISRNTATNSGGGLYCWAPSALLLECVITENTAGGSGGGLYLIGEGSPELRNCLVTRNTADEDGGGISSAWYAEPILSNSTIAYNTATNGYGGGLYCSYGSNTTVVNNIFWGNFAGSGGPQIAMGNGDLPSPLPSMLDVSYSDIEGGVGAAYVEEGSALNWDIGNIDVDPCFADTSSPDPNEWDYHLQSQAGRWDANNSVWVIDGDTSRCIDAGNPGTPLGDEEIDANNVRVNIGAYGGTDAASKTPANWALLSDITNDGDCDFEDFAYFAAIFANEGDQLYGDFDREGDVDTVDFRFLPEDWLMKTSWHE